MIWSQVDPADLTCVSNEGILDGGALATEAGFVLLVFVRNRWLRRVGLLMGFSLVAGLDIIMRLPNWGLFIMLGAFVDWNGIHDRIRSVRSPRSDSRRVATPIADPHVNEAHPAPASF